jgi:putative methyltransferase (TIGR04325 family)
MLQGKSCALASLLSCLDKNNRGIRHIMREIGLVKNSEKRGGDAILDNVVNRGFVNKRRTLKNIPAMAAPAQRSEGERRLFVRRCDQAHPPELWYICWSRIHIAICALRVFSTPTGAAMTRLTTIDLMSVIQRVAVAATPSYFVDRVRYKRFLREAAIADALAIAEKARQEAEAEAAREAAAKAKARLIAVSWQDACERADSYDAAEINRFRVQRGARYEVSGSTLSANLLAIIARLLEKPDLAITDFGGATGELGAEFLRAYPKARYTVVENPALVSMVTSAALRPGLSFVSTIPAGCDVFYSSGTLQYLDDPLGTLAAGLDSARLAVVLRRNNFSDAVRFDIQESRLFDNGAGEIPDGFEDHVITYPRRTLIEAEVRDLALARGFDCIAGLPGEFMGEGNYDRQLVFIRSQPFGR